jgi:hypothetical protein
MRSTGGLVDAGSTQIHESLSRGRGVLTDTVRMTGSFSFARAWGYVLRPIFEREKGQTSEGKTGFLPFLDAMMIAVKMSAMPRT